MLELCLLIRTVVYKLFITRKSSNIRTYQKYVHYWHLNLYKQNCMRVPLTLCYWKTAAIFICYMVFYVVLSFQDQLLTIEKSSMIKKGSFRRFHPEIFSKTLRKKTKFSNKDFFRRCDQIRRKLRIWPHLLKKALMEIFIFCTVRVEKVSRCKLLKRWKLDYLHFLWVHFQKLLSKTIFHLNYKVVVKDKFMRNLVKEWNLNLAGGCY